MASWIIGALIVGLIGNLYDRLFPPPSLAKLLRAAKREASLDELLRERAART